MGPVDVTLLLSAVSAGDKKALEKLLPLVESDIYSLGGVAYFLLTGRPPFEKDTLEDLYAAHVCAPVPCLREQNPDIPVDLESLIMRCLDKKPAVRYQSVDEVATALFATTSFGEWSAAQAKVWWQAHGIPTELAVPRPRSKLSAEAQATTFRSL